jgi:3-oxoacyl-[acyl-carrier-protein] synthase-1
VTSFTVTAIGMTTSLGLDSRDACAAARAGLVRLTEIDTLNAAIDPVLAKEDLDGIPPLMGHLAPVVGAGCSGLAKLLALSKPALGELLERIELKPHEWARTGLCVNISDAYFEGRFAEAPEGLDEEVPPAYGDHWKRTVAAFPERLRAALDVAVPAQAVAVFPGGRVGIIAMLRHAAKMIRGGLVDRCIVGGVDSCIHPVGLQSYATAGVLRSAGNPVGFFPGEAAAYFLLEQETTTTRAAVVRIAATAMSNDVPSLDTEAAPCGRGLSDAVVEVLGQGADGRSFPPLVIADLNGTESRAADWGYALVRLRSIFGEQAFDVWLPAQSFGETGAAAGAIAVCMAHRATERGYLPGAAAVVTLASEDGGRGAILLQTRAR